MDEENGPKLWADLLTAVKLPGSVVAGGCIRDWTLGVAPKDIDIFVPCKDMAQWLEVKYTLVSNTGMRDLLDTKEGKEYETADFSREANPLYGVLEGQLAGYTVNIIARTSHTSDIDLINLFDFGILQICWNQGGFTKSPAFSPDVRMMRATIAHNKHIEQSIARFMRFNNRHPGLLSLNVPYENTGE